MKIATTLIVWLACTSDSKKIYSDEHHKIDYSDAIQQTAVTDNERMYTSQEGHSFGSSEEELKRIIESYFNPGYEFPSITDIQSYYSFKPTQRIPSHLAHHSYKTYTSSSKRPSHSKLTNLQNHYLHKSSNLTPPKPYESYSSGPSNSFKPTPSKFYPQNRPNPYFPRHPNTFPRKPLNTYLPTTSNLYPIKPSNSYTYNPLNAYLPRPPNPPPSATSLPYNPLNSHPSYTGHQYPPLPHTSPLQVTNPPPHTMVVGPHVNIPTPSYTSIDYPNLPEVSTVLTSPEYIISLPVGTPAPVLTPTSYSTKYKDPSLQIVIDYPPPLNYLNITNNLNTDLPNKTPDTPDNQPHKTKRKKKPMPYNARKYRHQSNLVQDIHDEIYIHILSSLNNFRTRLNRINPKNLVSRNKGGTPKPHLKFSTRTIQNTYKKIDQIHSLLKHLVGGTNQTSNQEQITSKQKVFVTPLEHTEVEPSDDDSYLQTELKNILEQLQLHQPAAHHSGDDQDLPQIKTPEALQKSIIRKLDRILMLLDNKGII